MLRDLLDRVDLGDPHAFATAYVHHVEGRRAAGELPLPVTAAAQRWISAQSI